MSTGSSQTRGHTAIVVLSFLAIYLVWGSTYLAIRYAVEAIPPLLVAGTRHVLGGAILCAWAWYRGERPNAAQWRSALVLGVLFFLIGHGTLHWGEQVVPSGLAAVLMATEPVLIAALEPGRGVRRPRSRWLGFVFGLAGVAVLMQPGGGAAPRSLLLGCALVLSGAFSWALGVAYSQRVPAGNTPVLTAAMPMLCGGVMLYLAAALHGDFGTVSLAAIPPRSLLSVAYLTVFGSIAAFSAYMWLLERYPADFVATHTYVNPVVAILLGWAFAGEAIQRNLIVACVLILASIALIRSGRRAARSRPEPPPSPQPETVYPIAISCTEAK